MNFEEGIKSEVSENRRQRGLRYDRTVMSDLCLGRGRSWGQMSGKRKALWALIEKKNRINSNQIIHCPTSSGVSEDGERANK